MVDEEVFQLGRGSKKASSGNGGDSNVVLKQYKMQSIFPTSLSAIDLSYDTGDTIEEFTVEFQVQSFEYTGAGGPNS